VSIDAQNTLMQLQNNTNQVQYQQGLKNLGNSKLTREGFLRILMAQMQYQDPTEPQDYSQMLGQQVQLEQVDQMGSLVNATKFSQAAGMIGKTATLADAPWDATNGVSGQPEWDATTNSPKTVTGTIESVQFDQQHNKALVQVNGQYYDADQIRQVFNPTTASNNAGGG
jgi:flagellar basal-body rod modification protein FlgD